MRKQLACGVRVGVTGAIMLKYTGTAKTLFTAPDNAKCVHTPCN